MTDERSELERLAVEAVCDIDAAHRYMLQLAAQFQAIENALRHGGSIEHLAGGGWSMAIHHAGRFKKRTEELKKALPDTSSDS